MAKVFITCTDPKADDGYYRMLASAEGDEFGIHSLATDPETADLIIYVESWTANRLLTAARKEPIVRKYRSKCYVVCELDDATHLLPGIYSNIRAGEFLASRLRTGHYLWMYENKYAEYDGLCDEDDYLFSFVGSLKTASVRDRIVDLKHPRAHVIDTSSESSSIWWEGSEYEKSAFQRDYVDICKKSKFVLCPRGYSPSTVRLFEAMRMGRAPVVLSDAWVPPTGPNWESFAIRLPEREVVNVGSVLEAHEDRAAVMGLAARNAWETWFSPAVSFHRIVELCIDIQQNRVIPEWIAYPLKHVSLIGPQHIRGSIKECLRFLSGRH